MASDVGRAASATSAAGTAGEAGAALEALAVTPAAPAAPLTRRRALWGLGLAAGSVVPVSALAACGGEGGSPGDSAKAPPKADIRMMFFHAQWKEAFDEVIRSFQQRNPTITVEFGTAPPGSAGYLQALAAQLAADAGPDVMSINWDGVRTFTARNNLLDLTPEANRDRAFSRDLAAYHPKIQALMKVDGKQRGVGLDHDDIALYWNVSLFDQMQVPPLTAVHDRWTWNDLLELARRLTKQPEHQYGFYGQNVGGQTGYWNLVFANGGKVTNDDGSSFAPLLEGPAVEAIQWLADAAVRHGVSPQPSDMQAAIGSTNVVTMFQQGKIAMMIDGSWRLNAHVTANLSFEWDVAHLPHAPRTGKRSSVLHGTGFGVNAAGKAIDASVLFAKHLTTRETHKVYGTTGVIQSARMDEWDAFYVSAKPPKNRKVLKEAVDYSHQHPLTGQWGIITYDATDPIEAALTRVFAGAAPVREGLQDGVTQANQELAKRVAEVKAAKR
jgi:multiple sugar transport system substrate-binding protein